MFICLCALMQGTQLMVYLTHLYLHSWMWANMEKLAVKQFNINVKGKVDKIWYVFSSQFNTVVLLCKETSPLYWLFPKKAFYEKLYCSLYMDERSIQTGKKQYKQTKNIFSKIAICVDKALKKVSSTIWIVAMWSAVMSLKQISWDTQN